MNNQHTDDERSIDDRPTAEELRARQRADDPGVNVGDYVRVTRKAHAGFTGRVVAVDEQEQIVDSTGWEATIEQESGNRATFGCSLLEVLEASHAQ